MWTSTVRGSRKSDDPQTLSRSCERENTRPGLPSSVSRISNSTYVSWTGSPFAVTVRRARSSTMPARSRRSPGSDASSLRVGREARRSTARTREASSRMPNGFVM